MLWVAFDDTSGKARIHSGSKRPFAAGAVAVVADATTGHCGDFEADLVHQGRPWQMGCT